VTKPAQAVVVDPSIELDHYGELVTAHIALVTHSVGLLPGSPRQTVRAFHATRVIQLEDALDALGHLEQETLQELAVPDATPCRHPAPERGNRHAAALDRGDQQVDGATLGPFGAEIEQRVFG
jgi:hypothetical protein